LEAQKTQNTSGLSCYLTYLGEYIDAMAVK
jgi:hypothetical protein